MSVGKYVLVGLVAGSLVGIWASNRRSRKAEAARASGVASRPSALPPGEVIDRADQAANAASLEPRESIFDFSPDSARAKELAAARQQQRWLQAVAGDVYVPGVHTLET